jgi:hypothetical protein
MRNPWLAKRRLVARNPSLARQWMRVTAEIQDATESLKIAQLTIPA